VRIGADVQSANPKAQPSKLHYDVYPHLVEQIISHLPRGTLIPLRLSCARLRDHIDDVLSRGVCIRQYRARGYRFAEAEPGGPIVDLEKRRLPALLWVCGLLSLPQPHAFNNPNTWFSWGEREQAQAAYRAITRLGKAVRFIQLYADDGSCNLLVPLRHFLQPVPVLQVVMFAEDRLVTSQFAPAICAQTVVLGTVVGYSCGSDVTRTDPMIRYTPSLRKVVYNCDPNLVMKMERVIELPFRGEMYEEPISRTTLEQILNPPRLPRGTVHLAQPVEFVLIFHPVPTMGLDRQRAIICDALLLALQHDVYVRFVNTEVLPAAMFPFIPSDGRFRPSREVHRLPAQAERVGSALDSIQAFALATPLLDSGRVAFSTMDDYRERVGACRFAEETFATSYLAGRREKYQRMWEAARASGEDTFTDPDDPWSEAHLANAAAMWAADLPPLGAVGVAAAGPPPTQPAVHAAPSPPPANPSPEPPPGPASASPAPDGPSSAATNAVDGSPPASLAAELASMDLDRALARAWVQSLTPWLDWDTALDQAQEQLAAGSSVSGGSQGGSASQGGSGNQRGNGNRCSESHGDSGGGDA
jgi:hypothetical protein